MQLLRSPLAHAFLLQAGNDANATAASATNGSNRPNATSRTTTTMNRHVSVMTVSPVWVPWLADRDRRRRRPAGWLGS